jgi:hypothetical protein
MSKSNRQAKMTVASLYAGFPGRSYPVEIEFPADLPPKEQERIRTTLEEAVKSLGYEPNWVPLL